VSGSDPNAIIRGAIRRRPASCSGGQQDGYGRIAEQDLGLEGVERRDHLVERRQRRELRDVAAGLQRHVDALRHVDARRRADPDGPLARPSAGAGEHPHGVREVAQSRSS
jgi:hypothetical protein